MFNQDYFVNLVKSSGAKIQSVAVVCPHDVETLKAVHNAHELGFVNVILVGNKEKIQAAADKCNLSVEGIEAVYADEDADAAQKAADLVNEGRATMIMKGFLDTSALLKAIVKKENNLRTGRTLSHVSLMFKEGTDSMYIVTDGGMNLTPDLNAKKDIIENARDFAQAMGIEHPNVAMICAKEKPYPKMPATMDAAELQKMNQEGLIKDCLVSGPLQIDNAVSKESAELKGIKDPVAGNADIFVFPYIEVANAVAKTMIYVAGYKMAGLIMGAKVPIVLVSRTDGELEKLASIALASLVALKGVK